MLAGLAVPFQGPAPMPARAPATPLATEKAACRAAYANARAADPSKGAMFDRLYSETLLMTDGAPVAERCEQWRQSRILFQIFHNRAAWSAGAR
jgi:hypothetical protein